MGEFPDCAVKLCDFEISRLLTPGYEVREILGTPDYVGESADVGHVGKFGDVRLVDKSAEVRRHQGSSVSLAMFDTLASSQLLRRQIRRCRTHRSVRRCRIRRQLRRCRTHLSVRRCRTHRSVRGVGHVGNFAGVGHVGKSANVII